MQVVDDIAILNNHIPDNVEAEKIFSKQIKQVNRILPFTLGSTLLFGIIFYLMLNYTFDLKAYQKALNLLWLVYHTVTILLFWIIWRKVLNSNRSIDIKSLKRYGSDYMIFIILATIVGLSGFISSANFYNLLSIESTFSVIWVIYHGIILYVFYSTSKQLDTIAKNTTSHSTPFQCINYKAPLNISNLIFKPLHQTDYLANLFAYRLLFISMFLVGGLWSIGIARVITGSIEYYTQVIILIGLHFAVLSGAMSSIGIFRQVYIMMAAPSLLTWIIAAIYVDGIKLTILSLAMIVYFLTNVYFAKHYWLNSVETIQTYLKNTQLFSQLENKTEQLQYKSKQLEQASVAKTKLLASASHDLRQPVHALSLFLETLSMTKLDNHQQQIVDYARNASQSSREMLNSILDYSHLESGHMTPNFASTPLDDIIQNLVDEFQVISDKKGLALNYRPTAVLVWSDANMLSLILRNFLSNAIRYTKSGAVTIEVTPLINKPTDQPDRSLNKHYCRVSVCDTGSGLSADEIRVIFDSFHQLQRNNQSSQGLGLGLSISKGLSTLLNAPIHVNSSPKCGSRFSIDLLIADYSQHDIPPSLEDAQTSSSNISILVVDDEDTVLKSMQLLLMSWGYEALCCQTLDEAIELFKAYQPQIVITDFRLDNNEDGGDVIQAISALSPPNTRYVVLTGNTSPDLTNKVTQTDVSILHKPIEPKLLQDTIQRLLVGN